MSIVLDGALGRIRGMRRRKSCQRKAGSGFSHVEY
jgi:hypothetical protein